MRMMCVRRRCARAAARSTLVLALCTIAVGCGDGARDQTATMRPNVVLILADDMGFGDLSFTGAPDTATPNIDRLAAEGAYFSQFYTSAPVCSPTRAGLLTGRYQQRTGLEDVIKDTQRDAGLDLDERLIAEVLRDAGYATGLVGKWHLGYDLKFGPNRRGFDEFVGNHGGRIDYYTHCERPGNPDLWRDETAARDPRYTTDLITDSALDFIDRHRSEPFFLYVAETSPHDPYQPPGEAPRESYADGSTFFLGPGSHAVYVEMVEALDRSVGAILDGLRDRALLERTLVIFLSDNGGIGFGRNAPYQGVKSTLFEGGIRTPMMMRLPDRIRPGSRIDEPAISIDLFATLAEIAGASVPQDRPIDSRSLWPLISESPGAGHEALFWRFSGLGPTELAVRQGRWKLHVTIAGERILTDLETDPGEVRNLLPEHVDLAAQLERRLLDWESEVERHP